MPGNVTTKNAWGPNTLIKQGAKLVATWEDVWEDLPTQVRLRAGLHRELESNRRCCRILISGRAVAPAEALVMSALRHDEALQLDEIMEKLEPELSSSEIFTALV